MVMNIGALRSDVAADIAAVVRAARPATVKVILETAVLTPEQKALACRLAIESGVRFVKTSTRFHSAGGATVADVELLSRGVGLASA